MALEQTLNKLLLKEVFDIDTDIASTDAAYDPPLKGISIGVAGAIKIDDHAGNTYTIDANALAIGVQHVIPITKIYKTGTTATEVWGFR